LGQSLIFNRELFPRQKFLSGFFIDSNNKTFKSLTPKMTPKINFNFFALSATNILLNGSGNFPLTCGTTMFYNDFEFAGWRGILLSPASFSFFKPWRLPSQPFF